MRWLQAHNVPEPWNVASALAENFITVDQLDEFAAVADPEVLSLAIAAFGSSLRAERMAETVVDATVRIFDLISAIKSYSYMDQAAMQDVDIAQSLESTLSMFGSRLHDITIERDFDPELPPVSAYGSELTQVWTALIENALDAMSAVPGPGDLRLTAHRSATWPTSRFGTTAPASTPAIKSRIFEPFFTTKAVGSGLGLGLDTAQRIVARHSGFLTVESQTRRHLFPGAPALRPGPILLKNRQFQTKWLRSESPIAAISAVYLHLK